MKLFLGCQELNISTSHLLLEKLSNWTVSYCWFLLGVVFQANLTTDSLSRSVHPLSMCPAHAFAETYCVIRGRFRRGRADSAPNLSSQRSGDRTAPVEVTNCLQHLTAVPGA